MAAGSLASSWARRMVSKVEMGMVLSLMTVVAVSVVVVMAIFCFFYFRFNFFGVSSFLLMGWMLGGFLCVEMDGVGG